MANVWSVASTATDRLVEFEHDEVPVGQNIEDPDDPENSTVPIYEVLAVHYRNDSDGEYLFVASVDGEMVLTKAVTAHMDVFEQLEPSARFEWKNFGASWTEYTG